MRDFIHGALYVAVGIFDGPVHYIYFKHAYVNIGKMYLWMRRVEDRTQSCLKHRNETSRLYNMIHVNTCNYNEKREIFFSHLCIYTDTKLFAKLDKQSTNALDTV